MHEEIDEVIKGLKDKEDVDVINKKLTIIRQQATRIVLAAMEENGEEDNNT